MSDSGSYASESDEEEPEYEVEKILAETDNDGKTMYLVKWLGYDENQCTWEPAENFLTPTTLADWEQRNKEDTLNQKEIVRIQALMDTFNQMQDEKKQARERKSANQSVTKRPRESPLVSTQSSAKRLRESPATSKQPGSYEPMKSKKGIAQSIRSGQANTNSATVPNSRTHSSNMSQSSWTATSGNNVVPLASTSITQKSVNVDQPTKQGGTSVAATYNPAQTKSDKVSIVPAPRKLSSTHTTPTARMVEDKGGQRFNNLRHQNNYAKMARREPAPDITKLDLRAPDEWPSGGIRPLRKAQETSVVAARDEGRDSPLFVPEDNKTLPPGIGNEHPKQDTPKAPKAPPLNRRRQAATTTEAPKTVASVPPEKPPPSAMRTDSRSSVLSAALETRPTETRAPNSTTDSRIPVVAAPPAECTLADKRPPAFSTELRDSVVSAGLENTRTEKRPPANIEHHFSHRSAVSERKDSLTHLQQPIVKPSPQRPPADNTFTEDEVLTALNGRTYRKGEVIINLIFGDHVVGDVRFVHLPWWTTGKILHLKDPQSRSLRIYFKQKCVLDVDAFSVLSPNIERRRHGVGAIDPYEDTLQATESLIEFLEGNNLGAIWEYPGPGETLMLVLYSSRAPGWQHLEQPPLPMSGSRLHLAVLNKVPGFSLDNAPTRNDQSITLERDIEKIRPKPDLLRPQLRLSTSEQAGDQVQSPAQLPTPSTVISATKGQAPPVHTPKSPVRRNSTTFEDSPDFTASNPAVESQISFSANFDEMLCGLDKTQKRPRVFIAFAKTHPAEADAVKKWLSHYISPRFIFSDDEKNDWEEFQEEILSKTGVVLFHELYPFAFDLPHFYKHLRSTFVFCYSLSFSQPEEGKLDRSNVITRLFPRGTVLCITEETMRNHTEEALLAMKWFEESSFGKVQYWKLVLPPDFVSWILRQANKGDGRTQQRYIDLLEVLHKLRMRSFEASWSKGRRYDDPERFMTEMCHKEDDEFVVSPTSLPGFAGWENADMSERGIDERDNNLLEYFAGWAAMNATKYRKFMVLDAKHNNKKDKHSCHIWFRDPVAFVEQEKKRAPESAN